MQHTSVCRGVTVVALAVMAASILITGDAVAQQSVNGTNMINALKDVTSFGKSATSEITTGTKLLVGLGAFIGGAVLTVAANMGKFESKRLAQYGGGLGFFVAFCMVVWAIFGVG